MIEIKKGDITCEVVDAIVNAANPWLCGGGGVDGAIHRSAGPMLYEKCREIIKSIKRLDTSKAVITPAYNIKNVKYIIHTVGPVWRGGDCGEEEALKMCYENSMKLAIENNIKTIAFPSISTGAYGYPVELASPVAVKSLFKFIKDFEKIVMVLFSDYDFEVYKKEFGKYAGK